VSQLFLSPDDFLFTLPFEALVDGDPQAFQGAPAGPYLGEYATLHYLIDQPYLITYLPSASALRSLRQFPKPPSDQPPRTLVAFADPIFSPEQEGEQVSQESHLTRQILTCAGAGDLRPLPQSAEQAQIICDKLQGRKEDLYLQRRATEENVHRPDLQVAHYLLFSTHGLLGGDFPGVAEPALALTLIDNPPGMDGFLTMSEVLGLDLHADLTILSACNTYGQGEKAGRGEGFAGLTRSFLYAGTKSILVTHWGVEAEASRDLMVRTIQQMQSHSKPQALREAKRQMKGDTRPYPDDPSGRLSLAHPFFWAPFVLVGEAE